MLIFIYGKRWSFNSKSRLITDSHNVCDDVVKQICTLVGKLFYWARDFNLKILGYHPEEFTINSGQVAVNGTAWSHC
jgi:hypothetical protein